MPIVKAFVTLSAEYHEQLTSGKLDPAKLIAELQEHCRQNAAPYKCALGASSSR